MAQPSGLETLLMNGRPFRFLFLVLVVGIFPLRRGLSATLPENVRTTPNAAVAKVSVQPFITENIGKLTGADSVAQSAAKAAIIAEVQTTGVGASQVKPSDAFLDAYCEVLDAVISKQVKAPDVRVRLNLAVVAARVAEKSNNTRLIPTVVSLLGDDNEAVVLWAAKAVKFLIPPLFNGPDRDKASKSPLFPALSAAVAKFIKSAPLVQSAYEALKVENVQTPPGIKNDSWKFAVPVVAKSMQDIMAKRLELYAVGVPEMPTIETLAVVFLSLGGVQSNESPEQKVQSVQLIYNLMGLASQYLTKVPRDKRNELAAVITSSASGLSQCGISAADPIYKTNAGNADSDIQNMVNGLLPKIQAAAIPGAPGAKFQAVKAFPKVDANAPVPANAGE